MARTFRWKGRIRLIVLALSIFSAFLILTEAKLGARQHSSLPLSSNRRSSYLQSFDEIRGGSASTSGKIAISSKKPPQEMVSNEASSLNLIRFLFLCFYSSMGSLLPYLPVYYHSMGHGGMYIGYLGAVKPFTTFLVAPLWGILSDQTNAHSTILMFTFLAGLFFQLSTCFYDSFSWLITTVFFASIFNAPVKSLMDYMVMNTLPKENKSDYGKMRLWGQVGFGLGSSVIGMLLHKNIASPPSTPVTPTPTMSPYQFFLENSWRTIWHWFKENHLVGYKIAFFAHFVLSIPTFLCLRTFRRMEKIQFNKNKPLQKEDKASKLKMKEKGNSKIVQGLYHLSHNSEAIFFFFLVLVIGISSGVIENFAYVRIREVGGTGKEMGLCRLVSSAFGAPMFWFSGRLVGDDSVINEDLREETLLCLSLLSYVIRFFIYAFMKNPYHGLPAEALRYVYYLCIIHNYLSLFHII